MPTSQPNQPRRTLLLTGASRGIGHATVKRFSAAGWRVITCSRHAFPENCPWEAGPEDHIQVDLADEANTTEAIEEIKRRLEGNELHALVNNAAISPKAEGGKRMGTLDTAIEVWHQVSLAQWEILRISLLGPSQFRAVALGTVGTDDLMKKGLKLYCRAVGVCQHLCSWNR